MRIGDDHIVSVTNTLVLAYTASALPLILIVTLKNWPLTFILSNEAVMQPLIMTLLPTFGLIMAAPLTTAIAVLLMATPNVKSRVTT